MPAASAPSAFVEIKGTIFDKISAEICTFAVSYGIVWSASAPQRLFSGPCRAAFPARAALFFVFFDGSSSMRRDEIKQVHSGEKSAHAGAETTDQGRFGGVHSFLFSASAPLAPHWAAVFFCASIFAPGRTVPCPLPPCPKSAVENLHIKNPIRRYYFHGRKN